MQSYDIVTDAGLHFHISLSKGICYIMINDLYGDDFEIRYFSNLDSALDYIHGL